MDNSKHIIVKSILIPQGGVYLIRIEGEKIDYNKYKNYLVYFDTIDKTTSLNNYLKNLDGKILAVYQKDDNINVVVLKTIENKKLLFVYSFKKVKDVTKHVVIKKRKVKSKKSRGWSTIKIKNDVKQKLTELKELNSYRSFSELINHLIKCVYSEIEKENKELLETIDEIFNV